MVEGDNSTFDTGTGDWVFHPTGATTGSIATDAGGMRITKSGNNQVYAGVIVTPIPGEQYRFAVEVIENGGGASVALRVITGTQASATAVVASSTTQSGVGVMTLDWAAPAEPDGDVIVQIAMLGVSNTIVVDDVTCCPLSGGDR